MTHFICISGQAQHGKDTSAAIIKEDLEAKGFSVLITHYADLLKFICKNWFGWDGNKDESGRTLLQYVGTDCIRAQDPDYWVDFVANMVRMFPNCWDYVVIPDVRFPNELERISNAGFPSTHVRVVRLDFDNQLTEEQKNHPSENSLSDANPDFLIKNRSMPELVYQLSRLCDSIVSQREQEELA